MFFKRYLFLFQYSRSLSNFNAEQPHQHAIYYMFMLMNEQFWSKDQLLEAVEGLYFYLIGIIIRLFELGK